MHAYLLRTRATTVPGDGIESLRRVSPATKMLGMWSAALATICSLAYLVAQFAEWLGLLGSQGGPSSSSTAVGLVMLLTPSFFLASSFLILVVCIHQLAAPDTRVWSQLAVVFATAYAVLVSAVYFVQLTLVAPRIASGRIAGIESVLFVPFDSVLYAVDLLGYSFMSVATLCAAPVFTGGGLQRIVRVCLTANGLLLPFIALQMYFHPLIWMAALWAVTFPGATWALTLVFRRVHTTTRAWDGHG